MLANRTRPLTHGGIGAATGPGDRRKATSDTLDALSATKSSCARMHLGVDFFWLPREGRCGGVAKGQADVTNSAMALRQSARTELDDALIKLGSGDRAQMRVIYNLTSAKLFGIVLRVLRDRAAAEEVVQSVFVTVWQTADRFDPARASPITWLSTIARNRAIDRLRRRGTPGNGDETTLHAVEESSPNAEKLAELSEDFARLEGCMDGLEDSHAGYIRRAFYDGLTHREIADAESVPLGTMKSWIRRGLLKLRECLAS